MCGPLLSKSEAGLRSSALFGAVNLLLRFGGTVGSWLVAPTCKLDGSPYRAPRGRPRRTLLLAQWRRAYAAHAGSRPVLRPDRPRRAAATHVRRGCRVRRRSRAHLDLVGARDMLCDITHWSFGHQSPLNLLIQIDRVSTGPLPPPPCVLRSPLPHPDSPLPHPRTLAPSPPPSVAPKRPGAFRPQSHTLIALPVK